MSLESQTCLLHTRVSLHVFTCMSVEDEDEDEDDNEDEDDEDKDEDKDEEEGNEGK